MNIPFTKMQGLGNDFVVLDGVRHPIHLTNTLIQQMADRHFGIGFDQLLLVEPALQTDADFTYRIFNADGSEVSQCGNGARCVGRFLIETGLVPVDKTHILLSTKERLLEVHARENCQMAVNMGIPVFDPQKIPFQTSQQASQKISYEISLDQQTLSIGVVSMGNPHAVLRVDDVTVAPVDRLGKKLTCHTAFPEGVNVGFMQCISRGEIRLRVYERGVGETLACGSGACAAVVIGHMQGLLGTEVNVDLPGGVLQVSWAGEGYPVWMTGPAQTIFKGEWLLESV